MARISKSTEERLKTGLKKYQTIIQSALSRDINESDTVILVRDVLTDLFGYDRYADVTTEYCIRGTYCDLAVKAVGKLHFLIEVKAIGIQLKETHLRQAVGYASNEGVDWVILTNGVLWHVYKVTFQKPIEIELVFTVDFLNSNPKDPRVIEMLFLLSKEGITKAAIDEYHLQNLALNRFTVAAILMGDEVLAVARRELRKMHSDIKVDPARLLEIIQNDIVKRDIIEDERFNKEQKKARKQAAKKEKKEQDNEVVPQSEFEVKEKPGEESAVKPSEVLPT